uniref:Outer dynein arm-docking complex subunit 4 n=1 Tax=Mola mola TaxID=94237 RepID=A0A3Q3XKD6_MOLML
MSETDGDHERQNPKGVFSTLVANGDWLYLKGEFKKAIDSYTAALTLKPDEKSCLIGRSKCYLNMGQSENALRDADASLADDQAFFEGLYQKAEALYHMGEFEFAQVFYHRGQKQRPQIQEFRLGIQKAQEAIENSVGKETKKKIQKKTPRNEKTTRHLLGEFYSDKKYLENLLKDKLMKGKTKNGEQLRDVIQNSLSYLDTCTEFWSQEKPICTWEREHKVMEPKCSKPRQNAPSEPAEFLLKSLDAIDESMSGNAEGSLKKAEEVMKIVHDWSEKDVPNKKEVLGSLHSNALMDLGDMDKALVHHQKDLELAKQKLPEAMSRALDNMGRVYAQTGQFSQAIEWEKKIPLVRGGLEKAWLFHEIGLCYLALGCYDNARDYGVRSVAAADEIADGKWQINANVLVAQSEKLGNFESCISCFESALRLARLQEDDAATRAIQK